MDYLKGKNNIFYLNIVYDLGSTFINVHIILCSIHEYVIFENLTPKKKIIF